MCKNTTSSNILVPKAILQRFYFLFLPIGKKKKQMGDFLESKIECYSNYTNFLKPEVRIYIYITHIE